MIGDRIESLARALGDPVEPEQREALARYAALVRTWNARLDLTAARTDEMLCEVLFADALVLRDRGLLPEGASVLDVGSGAGAPALPVAVLRPDLRVTMIEPLRKRVAFLSTALGTLDLARRVRAIEARIDPLRPEPPIDEAWDLASARATFGPDQWARIGLALAPMCLVFATARIPVPAGARLAKQIGYALPWSGAPRVLGRLERA